MTIDVISAILLAGAAQGVLLSVVLLTGRRGDRRANRYLAVLLGLFALSMAAHALAHTPQRLNLPHHAGFGMVSFFLYGPLLYLYVRALSEAQFDYIREQRHHFAAFFIGLPVYFLANEILASERAIRFFQSGLAAAVTGHLLVYAVLTLKKLHRAGKTSNQNQTQLLRLRWLRFLVIGYVLTWLVAFAAEGLGDDLIRWNGVWIAVSVFIYLIGYWGLRQPEIFIGEKPALKTNSEKYQKSTLSAEMAEQLHHKLLDLMASQKLYLRSDLTLAKLAQQLSTSTHHLSQVINEKCQQNFFEFINSYRIKDAQQLIREPANRHKTLAEIGFEIGFNSITSFNSAFKKHAGMTPSQWRDGDSPP